MLMGIQIKNTIQRLSPSCLYIQRVRSLFLIIIYLESGVLIHQQNKAAVVRINILLRIITPHIHNYLCIRPHPPLEADAQSIENSAVGAAYLPTMPQLCKSVDVDMKD